MKIVILVAGGSAYFPLFIDKPKSLYHKDGVVQLERVIESAKRFVDEEDIIVVGGYKYRYIQEYLKKYPKITFKVNHNYNGPAVYTYRVATENINDDVLIMYGDESISDRNVERIAKSDKKLSLLYHDNYYFYSLGIFKIRKDQLKIFQDECYLDFEYMKKVYCFANKKEKYDGSFNINSGICMGYMTIDFVRRIGSIDRIEHPSTYCGDDIDFLHYNPQEEYVNDLDTFRDTDEYKNSVWLRMYSDYISDSLKRIMRIGRRIYGIFS